MTTFTWPEILTSSEKVNWRIEDILADEHRFDFRREFLPESLARTRKLAFLDQKEQLCLNHIRGHGYLYMFGVCEEFILPFVVDHARPDLGGDDHRTRALLGFAEEEAKHIHLFKRFQRRFRDDFGHTCDVIGPPSAIASAVLAHDPLSIALLTLQIEWMTQRHYLDSVQTDGALDERFSSLLRHHWMEEAQHAKMDTLIVRQLAAERTAAQHVEAVEGYLKIGQFFDEGLAQQARFDLDTLQRLIGRRLDAAGTERFLAVQHQALRWTYLGSGMTHPKFLATLGALGGNLRARVESVAPAFC
ncbi:MAG TPA: hypothetical protein VFD82_15725 [Planctomycetota bacterium]|nr:hypothetical protein [Planctomycetota bacterium]